ncbi:MAG TPA: nitrogen regulation protein NR(II) [Gammaproteobacteria bacterium]|nr:nitrogen regulation protein NR(II) [Gammaproteobacteria bacterium]
MRLHPRKTAPASPGAFGKGPLAGRAPDSDDILQSMTTAVVALDDALSITFLNPAAENLLGMSARQAVGRALADLVHPQEELLTLCRRVLASGLTFSLRDLAARFGERELMVDCRAAPLDVEPGLLLELVDTERDRKLRRESDLIAQQRLSRRIIRQLAHEVKNPLGGLRGAAQLLERQLSSAELKAYTQVIIDEADRLAALVDGILRAGGKPTPESINIHQITEHVASLIGAQKPAGVQLVRDYDPSLPPITIDRGQMIQAFLNLAQNALQAVGAEGRIVFRTRALSNHAIGGEFHRLVLCAEVEDSGPGIPEELRETIFYPLVTGRATGTGLGLTIAQDLVSRNGGLIEFTSKPGRTAFQMLLPTEVGKARRERAAGGRGGPA